MGGSSHSLIITNVAAGMASHMYTYNALNFATKSRKIVNRPTVSEKQEEPLPLKSLERRLEIWRDRREGGKENRGGPVAEPPQQAAPTNVPLTSSRQPQQNQTQPKQQHSDPQKRREGAPLLR